MRKTIISKDFFDRMNVYRFGRTASVIDQPRGAAAKEGHPCRDPHFHTEANPEKPAKPEAWFLSSNRHRDARIVI